ncbi:hypothetical protein MKX01_015251 [Papaver californicum]|nr:hypothetical protein MKX01_015251 [Papaver californicum]
MSITAHFLDKNWVLHKRIISYTLLDKSHSGEHIAELLIQKLVNEWGISKKIFALSMDNANANTVLIDRLKLLLPDLPSKGDLFHVICCCHILHLIVDDGKRKVKEFQAMISHVKSNLEFTFASSVRYDQFRILCTSMGLKPRKLQIDVKHRWNTSYFMLRDAIPYRAAISSFLADRTCYDLTDYDWDIDELLCKSLKPFL